MLQLESTWWWFVTALALLGLVALSCLTYLGKLRRSRWPRRSDPNSAGPTPNRDPKWISYEIERLCLDPDPTEPLIKQMSAEERALFEVSVIDALNSRTREGQHRLRSALIKCGYDEQCARRVMSEDLSDRVRATALLTLLRPQWRENQHAHEQSSSEDVPPRAMAARRATGSLEAE